jgi:hypothetical protein
MHRPQALASCTDPKHRCCGLDRIDWNCQDVVAAEPAAMPVGL